MKKLRDNIICITQSLVFKYFYAFLTSMHFE